MKVKTKRSAHRFGALLLALAMVLTLAPAAFAAETASTMQLTKTEGTVTVANASGRSLSVRDKMRLYNGYTIKTEAKSYAWVALDDTKLVKVDAASEIEVRKNGKNLELLVSSGNLLFNVTEPLKDDETLNICTSTMVAGVRGTTGWVEQMEGGSGLGILEGRVACTTASGVSVSVESGQFTAFSADGSIASNQTSLTDIPGFALAEVVANPALCAEIMEKAGLDIGSITPAQAAAKQAADEAETAQAIAAVRQAAAKQPGNSSSSGSSSSSDSSSSSSGGSGGGTSKPDTPPKPDEPTKPDNPSGPDNPTKPDNPSNPDDPTNPDNPKPDNPGGSTSLPTGYFNVVGGTLGTDYMFKDGALTILTDTPLTISNKAYDLYYCIVVSKSAPAVNVTLNGICLSSEYAPFVIPDGYTGNVTITLAAGSENTLRCQSSNFAGLQKNDLPDSNSGVLTIKGTGSLEVTGGTQGAAIGSSSGRDTSNIRIENGKITAVGGKLASGIGGGYGGKGTGIEITGGTLDVSVNTTGAAIGGNKGCDVTISGGTVTAKGNDAGIGSGGGDVKVNICGGTVTATAGYGGAGIGSGDSAKNIEIKITDSTVKATGGAYGAGIGGGFKRECNAIEITNSEVTATGGSCAAGIGGGGSSESGASSDGIKITDSFVTAIGGDYCGAGIGGGRYAEGTNIEIINSRVTASSADGTTAGIGGSNGVAATVSGNSFVDIQTGDEADSSGLNVQQGIVFCSGWSESGKMVGNVTLRESVKVPVGATLEISENDTLTIPSGVVLTVAENTFSSVAYLTNNGTIQIDGIILGVKDISGTVQGSGRITDANGNIIWPSDTEPDNTGTGDFIVTGGTAGEDYIYKDSVLTILKSGTLTIRTKKAAWTNDRIEVANTVSDLIITLDNVAINTASKGEPAFKIADGSAANVTIKLATGSENYLRSGAHCAGLQKNDGDSTSTGWLVIEGPGSLTATGGSRGAGIGGACTESDSDGTGSTSNIEIRSGIITAKGGYYAAGIGSSRGDGKNIKITGGVVTASSSDTNTAGIGTNRDNGYHSVEAEINGDAFVDIQTGYTSGSSLTVINGIVFYKTTSGMIGKMAGNVTFDHDVTISENMTLTIPSGSSLTLEAGVTLHNKGTIAVEGTLQGNIDTTSGTVTPTGNGKILDAIGDDITASFPAIAAFNLERLEEPTEPAPEQPTDTEQPTEPAPEQPTDTDQPTEPESPEDPDDTTKPETPDFPEDASDTTPSEDGNEIKDGNAEASGTDTTPDAQLPADPVIPVPAKPEDTEEQEEQEP